MVRPVDVKSKTMRLIFAPNSIEQEKISQDFKTLCLQDGKTANQLLEEFIILGFKIHHWPPGNPQQQIIQFTQEKLEPIFKCCKCGRQATKSGYHIPTKENRDYCDSCFKEVPMRYDSKVWLFKKAGGS